MKATTPVIAAALHELLNRRAGETFVSDADASEALKVECARLRLPYNGTTVHEALTLVERSRRVVVRPVRRVVFRDVDMTPAVVSRAEATAILQRLGVIR